MPLLSQQFTTDGHATILLPASPAGAKLAGMIGSLQRATYESAKTTNCSLPQGMCQCSIGENSISCSCYRCDLEDITSNSQLNLLLSTPGLVIRVVGKNCNAHLNNLELFKLQAEFKDYQVSVNEDANACDIRIISLKSCYNCLAGAKLE